MSDQHHYDVIVIGAGPAGSCTAQYIHPNRSGKRVLILESKKQVGIPMQCGEALPTYAELLTIFPGADCAEIYDIPAHIHAGRIEGLRFKAPSGKSYVAHLKGQMFHRDKLDQHFFASAVENGAEYKLGARVKRIQGNRVLTVDQQYTADIIVGADGVHSVVAASFPAFRPNRDICPCAFVLAEGEFDEEIIQLWFESRFPGGYFWLFPKNAAGEANIGLGVRGPTAVRRLLDQVLKELQSQYAFTIKQKGGGAVPLGGLKNKIVDKHVALVGDAAGMVFPTNGGGTGVAMMAGKWLGEMIAAGQPLIEYEKKIQALVRPVLKSSLRTRKQMDFFRKNDRIFSALMWVANQTGWRSFIIG
ncbi:NAD(P)/FAD-dependent oxidoreductase [bacterium]|nr:NAD(P)/FAD-dependent oxidoreductase [bacterium]